MCINEIVAELYQSKEFNDCIRRMEPEHLRDDLRSEVILILLETRAEKLLDIYQKGALKFYTVRIILNLIQSTRSDFYKRYRQPISEFTADLMNKFSVDDEADAELVDEKEAVGRLLDQVIDEVDGLYWYNRQILELYMKHGNYRAIEKETRIPYSSAYKTVQHSFKQIKQKITSPRI